MSLFTRILVLSFVSYGQVNLCVLLVCVLGVGEFVPKFLLCSCQVLLYAQFLLFALASVTCYPNTCYIQTVISVTFRQ